MWCALDVRGVEVRGASPQRIDKMTKRWVLHGSDRLCGAFEHSKIMVVVCSVALSPARRARFFIDVRTKLVRHRLETLVSAHTSVSLPIHENAYVILRKKLTQQIVLSGRR